MIRRGDRVKFGMFMKLVSFGFKGVKQIVDQSYEVLYIEGGICAIEVDEEVRKVHKSLLVKCD